MIFLKKRRLVRCSNVWAHMSLLLLLGLGILGINGEAEALVITPSTDPFLINFVTITGPSCISCPGSGDFTVKMSGTGAVPLLGVKYTVIDSDVIVNDPLQDYKSVSFEDVKTNPAPGSWKSSFTFTLSCGDDKKVKGSAGTSGETTADVFLRFQILGGIVGYDSTPTFSVSCCTPPAEPKDGTIYSNVPAPGTLGLFALALMGFIALPRNQLRRSGFRNLWVSG